MTPFTATTRDGWQLAGERMGDGIPVVLVMGLGMPGHIWSAVREGLLADHAVVTFDNRGILRSQLPERPYHMVDLGDDVVRVMDAAGFDSAHVVGVSMGGMAVQETALGAPGRVRSLTLIATHSGGLRAILPKPRGLWSILQTRFGPKSGRSAALGRLLYPPDAEMDPLASPAVRHMAEYGDDPKQQAATRLQLGAVRTHRTTGRLASLAGIPTQVVRPGRDVLCRPSNNDQLAARIPGAQLVRFDEAGHGIIVQSAARLAEQIRAHVADAEQQRG
jgi:pimeloyl-ACP methyl ester carboxylesterase